jgi:hypothetical protein
VRPARRRRVADLRFAHPYAVVAVTVDGNGPAPATEVRGSEVRGSAVRRGAVRGGAVRGGAVRGGAVHRGEVRRSEWHGLPVFSAWVAEPDDAADESDSAGPGSGSPV